MEVKNSMNFIHFHEKLVCVCVCIDNCAWEIIVYIGHVFKVICEPKGYCEWLEEAPLYFLSTTARASLMIGMLDNDTEIIIIS